MLHQVHHGKGHDHRFSQVGDLGGVQQVAPQVAGVNDHHHQVHREVSVWVHDGSIRNPFVCTPGIEAVGSGQVKDLRLRGFIHPENARFLFHGHPGEIPHFLVQSRKGVEQGRLSAIGVSKQGDM